MLPPVIPLPILYMTVVSGLVCLPIFALSIVNFGLLSIWLNAAVSVFIAVHHLTLCIVSWVSRKRLPSTKIIIDDEESSFFLDDPEVDPPAAYSRTNIASLVFLVILNAIAFSIMVDITTRGAMKSTLPAERVGSHKWNIKIQIGQSSILGVELLVLSTILTICTLGRKRIVDAVEERRSALDLDY
ncbi:hypothetical protein BJ912DRAFT_548807 [Pholiota molesta]|nr:hypothetical protein BJ912DRAFT_548807 [Pholiota molesta]